MSNTEPLDKDLAHVKVQLVHTRQARPAHAGEAGEAGALEQGSDLKVGKIKHPGTWGLKAWFWSEMEEQPVLLPWSH